MFSRLLTGTAVPADERSVLPGLRGVPWWGAVLIAGVITAIGAYIDAGSTAALGRSFKLFYLIGCVLAALLVRRRALFTAGAQPPLIAFVIGILTLYTANREAADGMRAIILKVVLPIATSFPWMVIAFIITLAVVVARFFLERTGENPLLVKLATALGLQDAAPARPAKKTQAARAGADRTRTQRKTPTQKASGQKASGQKAPGQKAAAQKSGSPARSGRTPTPAKGAAPAKKAAPERRRAAPSRVAPPRAADQPRPGQPRPEQPQSGQRGADQRGTGRPASAGTGRRRAADPAPDRRQSRPRRDEGTRAAPRRAAPQTVPPRQPEQGRPTQGRPEQGRPEQGRPEQGSRRSGPRRTAGEQLRDRGTVEDLTAGADDR
ncbi:DUF6542 domain-containing protein [Gordonia shandongensis]|uniref:DUF6542 domain-containing protein n=1 Tax=Gordonia shandongensis TaxID=376351 RepID=UPI0004106AEC|nr:DUF6542 domain-containing protein [Gordonia shandongensis]